MKIPWTIQLVSHRHLVNFLHCDISARFLTIDELQLINFWSNAYEIRWKLQHLEFYFYTTPERYFYISNNILITEWSLTEMIANLFDVTHMKPTFKMKIFMILQIRLHIKSLFRCVFGLFPFIMLYHIGYNFWRKKNRTVLAFTVLIILAFTQDIILAFTLNNFLDFN